MATRSPPLKTFHPFPNLPTELRLKIWQHSLPGPRVLHLLHNRRINHLVTTTPTPSLLRTSQESRAEGFKVLKLFFDPGWDAATAAVRSFPYVYINPEVDTFYFPTLNNRPLPLPFALQPGATAVAGAVPLIPAAAIAPAIQNTNHILRVQASDLDNLQLNNTALYPIKHLAFSDLLWQHFFRLGINTHVFLLEFRDLESVTIAVDCTFLLTRKELSFYDPLGGRGGGMFATEDREGREYVLKRVAIDARVQVALGVGPLQRRNVLEGFRDGMRAKMEDLKVRDPMWKIPRVEVKVLMRGDWV
ncbi:hypothetical protein BKA65DRAFT_577663 [Rhexocercosporidium sp. MPI-PUGE-AT-0058]|nr:hypothetical protein BKA65DRAFT_577663 [Rhexocercosporidium sp. MPI-PUGE-AT-0058]